MGEIGGRWGYGKEGRGMGRGVEGVGRKGEVGVWGERKGVGRGWKGLCGGGEGVWGEKGVVYGEGGKDRGMAYGLWGGGTRRGVMVGV